MMNAMETKTSKGKEIGIPGPGHHITISPAEGRVRVMSTFAPCSKRISVRRVGVKTLSDKKGIKMPNTKSEQNKALVFEAFHTLFNKRDYVTAERFWSPHYIQHSAHIAPRREGLFNLIKSLPPTLKYESGMIVAEGDFVIVHGRFSDFGAPANWIAADIVRIENGTLAEHWDVIEDEATDEQSMSKRPMFGSKFPK